MTRSMLGLQDGTCSPSTMATGVAFIVLAAVPAGLGLQGSPISPTIVLPATPGSVVPTPAGTQIEVDKRAVDAAGRWPQVTLAFEPGPA